MTTPINNPNNIIPPFLPATYNIPEEEDRRLEWMGTTFSEISDVVNDKVVGMFVENVENYNGHKFFYDTTKKLRNGFRFLLRIASYPNTTTLTIPLPTPFTNQIVVSQVWGSASKPPTTPGNGDYFSFYSEGNSKITFVMNDKNVIITTTADMTAYSGFIICDNIKDGF